MAKMAGGTTVATEAVCPVCGGVIWQKDSGTNDWACPTDGYTRSGTSSWSEEGHN